MSCLCLLEKAEILSSVKRLSCLLGIQHVLLPLWQRHHTIVMVPTSNIVVFFTHIYLLVYCVISPNREREREREREKWSECRVWLLVKVLNV